MSDDDEVVLKNSVLHNYMKLHFDQIESDDDLEIKTSSVGNVPESSYNEANSVKSENCNFLAGSVKICDNVTEIIVLILETGLLYPDHLTDIENYLNFIHVKSKGVCRYSTAAISSCLLGTVSSVTLYFGRLRHCSYVSVFIVTAFCSFNIYKYIRWYIEKKYFKHFVTSIEQLFSLIKKALSFVLESEVLLRSKISKQQPFYGLENGWINPNTASLKCSGFLLLDIRKTLSSILLDLILTFNSICNYLRTELPFLPEIDDCDYIDLLNYNDLKKMSCSFCFQELKQLENLYLLTQSECLRRLALSFIKDFWSNFNSEDIIKSLLTKLTIFRNQIIVHHKNLESVYKSAVSVSKYLAVQNVKRNVILKAKCAKDKLFIFIRNFLSRADAHILSMSLDLNMINDWINECEKNSNDSNMELVTTLQNKLKLIKSNNDCFNNLFNDNFAILSNTINNYGFSEKNTHSDGQNASNSSSASPHLIKKTGIEVGKSQFGFSVNGISDEVLVSLSESMTRVDQGNTCSNILDYEDSVQKRLPKTVLTELKSALKNKKEEWIEREKIALKSSSVIDNLEFDELLTIVDKKSESIEEGNDSVCKPKLICEIITEKMNSEYCSNSAQENTMTTTTTNKDNGTDIVVVAEDKDCDANELSKEGCEEKEEMSHTDYGSSSVAALNAIGSSQNTHMYSHGSFLNQIKNAQKLFNLKMQEEEEFIEGDYDDVIEENLS